MALAVQGLVQGLFVRISVLDAGKIFTDAGFVDRKARRQV
jgi:hypothetical protein